MRYYIHIFIVNINKQLVCGNTTYSYLGYDTDIG